MILALLLQLPGVESLPGLPTGYVPTAGAEMAWEVHDQLVVYARVLMLALLAVGLILGFLAPAARLRVTAIRTVLSLFTVLCLFATHVHIYGWIMGLGHSMATGIVSEEQQAEFDQTWELAGDAAALEEMTPGELNATPWYVRWAAALLHASPGGVVAMELIASFSTAAFLLATTFVSMLWRALVTITFVMGPICIVFGLLPSWGPRVTTTWLILTCHFSLWQVWIAICTLFVNKADQFLSLTPQVIAITETMKGNETIIPNTYEAILIQLVSVFLVLGVPVMVALFFPWGRASTMMAWGMMDGAKTAMRTTMSAASMAKGGISAGAGKVSVPGGSSFNATSFKGGGGDSKPGTAMSAPGAWMDAPTPKSSYEPGQWK